MNVDEMMMSNPTANNNTPRDNNVEAMLGSPASSQTQAQAHALAQIKANTWNTNKFREEYEAAKSRLSDQKFSMTDYPDPLMPRQIVHKQAGFTPEAERELKEFIAKFKNSGSL